ncbi:MAG: thiamine pyrophosphate-dependent enzyme, partial [Actinomycetes bacterium]
CRQEGGAGFMALAEGRLTKRPGVVMVTRGPGAANAAIAVHTAWQDATPLLLFVGLIPVADRARESFQEFDLNGWFGTTAKKVVTLDSADRAAEIVADAAHLATSGRPGPVVIGLPEDVLLLPCTVFPVRPRAVATGAVCDADVDRFVRELRSSSRPLVVAGGDMWTPESSARLAVWAESWELPVVTDWRAQDVIDNGSPSFAGWLGYGRSDGAAALLQSADLVCFLGCGNADVLSDGYRLGAANHRVVVVDPDPALLMHSGDVDVHLLATPPAFLSAVAGAPVDAGPRPWHEWWTDARGQQEEFAGEGEDRPAVGVDLAVAMRLVRERLDADAVVTYGAGNHALWAQRYLTHHAYPSLLAPRNGAMGFGVPAAVAAALAFPSRQVVSVAGDGCFLMNGQEIATAVAQDVAPLVLVVDNGRYGTIAQHQDRHYPGRVSGTDLVNPDFAAFAESFGALGRTVRSTDEMSTALDDALASGRAAVLHLLADPDVREPSGKEQS